MRTHRSSGAAARGRNQGPAGTPKPIIAKLHGEIINLLKQPTMNARLAAEGAPPIGSTPDEFAKFMREELVKWAAAVKQAGARID